MKRCAGVDSGISYFLYFVTIKTMEVLNIHSKKCFLQEEKNIENLVVKLDSIIFRIILKSEKRNNYTEFVRLSDSKEIIEKIWEYIHIVNNNMNLPELGVYWLYIREYLPLVLEFPYLFVTFEDERFVKALEKIIHRKFNMDDPFSKQISDLTSWNSEKIIPLVKFLKKHEDLNILDDDSNRNISRIVKSYVKAVNSVFDNYDENMYNIVKRGLLISI